MTNYKILSAIDKDSYAESFEDILDQFVGPDGICRTCGKDHRYRPIFENTSTSIDIIPLLLQILRKQEQAQESGIII
jgi:hypothetical protein